MQIPNSVSPHSARIGHGKSNQNLLPMPATSDAVCGLYWQPNAKFLSDLVESFRGKRVLEVFAGNGYLAACLAQRGIDVLATSQLSGHDGHDHGFYHPVVECGAVNAVRSYGSQCDVLLMCWPTVTEEAFIAARLWGQKPVCFIGEFTCYDLGWFGGCATDNFFASFRPITEFASYKGQRSERACLGVMPAADPAFDRARESWEKGRRNRVGQAFGASI